MKLIELKVEVQVEGKPRLSGNLHSEVHVWIIKDEAHCECGKSSSNLLECVKANLELLFSRHPVVV